LHRKIDLIHQNQMDQPQSFGDFPHGRLHRLYTKLTCLPFSYHYHHRRRSKGTTSLPRYGRGTVHRETHCSLANRKSTSCAFHGPTTTTTPTYTRRNQKERQAYSLLLQTTMEPLPHGLLVLSSSKPLTGRTGHKLRDASATGIIMSHSLYHRNTLPDKDSSQDDMPCRHPLH